MSVDELKKGLSSQKVVYGAKETIQHLKQGKTTIVFLAKNCDEEAKKTIVYYADLQKVRVETVDIPSTELSVMCKKNFPVNVISW